MLVMSRKEGEGFMIGDDVHVQIVKVRGRIIGVGISAPPHVKILRDELEPFDKTPPANAVNS
jgi:carbon storage regulator